MRMGSKSPFRTCIDYLYLSTASCLLNALSWKHLYLLYFLTSLEGCSYPIFPMDVPLPSLRPQTPQNNPANFMSGSVDTSSAHSCRVMCVQLTSEVRDLRARLDGLEQLVLFMKRHLGLRSYPLVRLLLSLFPSVHICSYQIC